MTEFQAYLTDKGSVSDLPFKTKISAKDKRATCQLTFLSLLRMDVKLQVECFVVIHAAGRVGATLLQNPLTSDWLSATVKLWNLDIQIPV